MSDRVIKFIDQTGDFFEALSEVPKWRLFIAFFVLGENVSKKLKEILT